MKNFLRESPPESHFNSSSRYTLAAQHPLVALARMICWAGWRESKYAYPLLPLALW